MKIGGGSGNRVSPPVEPPKNEGVAQPKPEKTSGASVDLEKTQDIYVDPRLKLRLLITQMMRRGELAKLVFHLLSRH